MIGDIPVTFTVDTTELKKQINNLDLNELTVTELEQLIRENLEVTWIKNDTRRLYQLKLKDGGYLKWII